MPRPRTVHQSTRRRASERMRGHLLAPDRLLSYCRERMGISNVAVGMSVALLGLWQHAAGQTRPPEASPGGAAGGNRASCALASTAPVPSANDACLACHGGAGSGPAVSHSHPVDVDYAGAQRRGGSLRPMAAVVARGVKLPNGRLQCVTCHDARSPWARWIALPAGAVARPARPAHAEGDENSRSWRLPPSGPSPELPRGTEVSAAPLCAACHTFAD